MNMLSKLPKKAINLHLGEQPERSQIGTLKQRDTQGCKGNRQYTAMHGHSSHGPCYRCASPPQPSLLSLITYILYNLQTQSKESWPISTQLIIQQAEELDSSNLNKTYTKLKTKQLQSIWANYTRATEESKRKKGHGAKVLSGLCFAKGF